MEITNQAISRIVVSYGNIHTLVQADDPMENNGPIMANLDIDTDAVVSFDLYGENGKVKTTYNPLHVIAVHYLNKP